MEEGLGEGEANGHFRANKETLHERPRAPSRILYHGEAKPAGGRLDACQAPVLCLEEIHEVVMRQFSPAHLDHRAHDVAHHVPQEAVRFHDES